ncbi:hypothetical protein T03_12061 [Trichinella britovi]|uniref:Uncharacterized protein n=2 Tax=Trichinella TaxID=6333 RepID=A0A0V1CK10_TRIBR|nr:hypothetical protein T05_14808 [Trichinella murrelli]KRY49059.1 hypothetical protein T03_12061 [Trichinella britovi]KRZ94136.1 hypothetical protein T08_8089 [Trichinella sp. T8]
MHCESKENKKQYLRARILLNGQQPNMFTNNSHYTYDHLKFHFMLMISNIPCGIVARICGFHPQGPGLIPGMGKRLLCYFY